MKTRFISFALPLVLLGIVLGCSANDPTVSPQQPATIQIVINEFMASNDSSFADEHGDFDDWIELYNAGSKPVNVGGMYITDDLTNPTLYQIPATSPDSTTIAPGGFLILWADKQPEQGVLHVGIKLSGSGEQIGLFADKGTVVDSITFGAQKSDVSYGRVTDGTKEWKFFDHPTPGGSNGTAQAQVLFINEFLASNSNVNQDEDGNYDDWIELYNAGNVAVNIGGMYITDDLEAPTKYKLPDGMTISGKGFLLIWCDKDGNGLHTNFKLSSGGEQIGLYDRDGVTPIDTLTYGAQTTDVSYGRLPDGSSNWQFFQTPTPEESNH